MKKINQTRQSLVRAMYVLGAFMLAVLSPMLLSHHANAIEQVVNNKPPGSILSSRPMILNNTLRQLAIGKQIVYVSTDINGNRIAVSGAVLTPKNQTTTAGQRNIVAWAHGTQGIADSCAPSRHTNLDANPSYENYANVIADYITSGWTVAATDYPGLGTPGEPLYLHGESEARAVIDSVRAARVLDRSLSNNWVASGHSQGGQAVLFASKIAKTYSTDLNLKGVVGIAPASNLEHIAPYIPGTEGNGFLVMALYGLAATDPTVVPEKILAQPALDRAGVLATGCYPEILGAYYGLSAEQLLVGGALSKDLINKLVVVANPARLQSTVPVMLVQGDYDVVIPMKVTLMLHEQLCSSHMSPIQFNAYTGQDHDSTVSSSMKNVNNYINDRFANKPAPSNCQKVTPKHPCIIGTCKEILL